MTNNAISPPAWQDSNLLILFLRLLVHGNLAEQEWVKLKQLDPAHIVGWISEHNLGPLAHKRARSNWPELASLLQGDAFAASAENSIHAQSINQVLTALNEADISPGLLKGIVLAEQAWGELGLRPMNDIDLWLPDDDLRRAVKLIQELGYKPAIDQDRPIALQQLAEGEIEFAHPKWQQGGLDLHWSPFHGWWFRWATAVSTTDAWENREVFKLGELSAYRLNNADLIIHLATHLAINEQFAPHAVLRGLLDIVFAAKAWQVDWKQVAQRAQEWQVTNVIWAVFDLLSQLEMIEGVDELLQATQPSPLTRRGVRKLISAEFIIEGVNLQFTRRRQLLILLLTDRWRTLGRYFKQVIWPDQEWLNARYGPGTSHATHIRELLFSSRA